MCVQLSRCLQVLSVDVILQGVVEVGALAIHLGVAFGAAVDVATATAE